MSAADTQADVNGPETQPIWAYLKEHADPPVKDIDWNFSKFLIKDGKIKWFPARSTKVVSCQLLGSQIELTGTGRR